MKTLITILLFIAFISVTVGCQSHRKLRKLVSMVDSFDEALYLKKKYPKSDIEIHKLDSITFFSHSIYSRLKPGILMRIGQENSQVADLYKLLRADQTLMNKTDNLHYHVLQVHLK